MHLGMSDKVLLSKDGKNALTLHVDGQGIDEHFGDVKTTVNYFVTDHLGTVVNGAIVGGKKVTGVYGEPLNSVPDFSEDSPAVNYGYTGRSFDLESHVYYYRARYYDPQNGRFLSSDPIGLESGDTNLYRYVFNNSVKLSDPSGLKCDLGKLKLSNKEVRQNLSKINQSLVDQGFDDDSFTITVTGGDSYIDSKNVVRSSTDNTLVIDSNGKARLLNSAHNIENGARAVDIKISGSVNTQRFLNTVKTSSDFVLNPKLKYSDRHIHLRIPGGK